MTHKEYQRKWHKKNPSKGAEYKRRYIQKNPKAYLLANPRLRARRSGMEFDLTPDDIEIPTHCPVLGAELTEPGTNSKENQYGPSVHRIDPSKGYVKGNVMVVSWRANNLLKDGNLDEFKMIYQFLEQTAKKEED